ncbi:hypothetical protein ABBQ38_010057 [Trebouxia sp. C0009 RCD-2024]
MGRTASSFLPLVCYLLTGTAVTTISQVINNKHFTGDSVQALACIKYVSTLLVSLLDSSLRSSSGGQGRAGSRAPPRSAKQKQLMLVIGCIDVMAYAAFCIGFAYCDGAVATLVLAAGGQIFTAILSKYIMKKSLTQGQLLGVALVCIGLCMRGIPSALSSAKGDMSLDVEATQRMYVGLASLVFAALAYSLLGVMYQTLVSVGENPPSHGEIMLQASLIGLASMAGYEVFHVLPKWPTLVKMPMQQSGTTTGQALGLLATFGAVYNCHSYASGVVFRTDGAQGVGIVNAMRGATVAIVSHLCFCSPQRPLQCLTPLSAASAATVTAGGIIWVKSASPVTKPQKKQQ